MFPRQLRPARSDVGDDDVDGDCGCDCGCDSGIEAGCCGCDWQVAAIAMVGEGLDPGKIN